MKKIYNVGNSFEEKDIVAGLAENGIHPYVIDSGSGQYMRITAGFSVYGKDIYVEEEDAERAVEIINRVKSEEKTSENDNADKVQWYRNKAVLARILIGLIAIQVIIILVLNI